MEDLPYPGKKVNSIFTVDIFLSTNKKNLVVNLVRILYADKKTHKQWCTYPSNYYLTLDKG